MYGLNVSSSQTGGGIVVVVTDGGSLETSYFAFTKKAANEAKSRAMDKFNYSEDDLPYFRTMHSLAFRRLGVNKDQVMQRRHYEDLGRKLNLFIDYNEYDE